MKKIYAATLQDASMPLQVGDYRECKARRLVIDGCDWIVTEQSSADQEL